MADLSRAGIRIHYEDAGSAAPACVLVHGWCCDLTTMAPLVEHLAPTHRVLNMDLRGHGQSDKPERGYSLKEMAGDIVAIAELAGSPVVLIGHSMGGRIALAAAAARPDLVRALIVLDSALIEDPAYVVRRRAELDDPQWRSLLRARFSGMFPFGPPSDDTMEKLLAMPLPAARGSLDGSDELDAKAVLDGLRLPFMYVGSSRPRHEAAVVRGLRADATYGQVVGAGHFVQFDARGQLNEMVDRFLKLSLGA
jgi:pimeloyl-ACP methyl ester carboxylesterase